MESAPHTARALLFAVSLAALSACDRDYQVGTRGAMDAGSAADAGSVATPDAGDAGTLDAGDKGDGGPFTFTELSTPTVVGFWGVHGSDPTRTFVVATHDLFHLQGEVWTQVLTTPGSVPLHAVYVTPTEVHLASSRGIYSCSQNCTLPGAAFVETLTLPNLVRGFCSSAEGTVYAVGYNMQSFQGVVLKRSGQGWQAVFTTSQVSWFSACWVNPQGELFIAGRTDLAHYSPADGGIQVEQPDYSSTSANPTHVQWNAIHGSGGALFAVGSDRLIIQREASGQWRVVFDPGPDGGLDYLTLTAIGSEWLATGWRENPEYQWAHFDGTRWKVGAPLNADLQSVWPLSAREVLAVGKSTVKLGGAAFRGTR